MPVRQGIGARIDADVGGFVGGIGQALGSLGKFRNALIGVGALTAGGAFLSSAINEAVRFESQIAEIQKVTDAFTASQMRSEIKGMAEEIPLARREIASIVEASGRMGVEGTENIARFTETVGKISVATELTASDAGRSFGRLAALMNLPIDQMDRLGAIVNRESNNIKGDAQDIVDSMLRSAGAAREFGLSAQQITSVNSALIEVSESSERAGTRLRRLFQEITDPNKVEVFAQALGMTNREFQRIRQQAPLRLFTELVQVIRQGGDAAEFLRGELSTVSRQALTGLASNFNSLRTSLSRTNSEWQTANSLNEEYAVQANTRASRTQLLANKMDNLQESIGSRALPAYAALLEHLNDSLGVIDRVTLGMDKLQRKMGSTFGAEQAQQISDALSLENQGGVGGFLGQIEEGLQRFTPLPDFVSEALFPSQLIESFAGNELRRQIGNRFVNTLAQVPEDIRPEVRQKMAKPLARMIDAGMESGLSLEEFEGGFRQLLRATITDVMDDTEDEVSERSFPELGGVTGARPAQQLGVDLTDEQIGLIRDLQSEFQGLRGMSENQVALQQNLANISAENVDEKRSELEKWQEMNDQARQLADAQRLINRLNKRANQLINERQQEEVAPELTEQFRKRAEERLRRQQQIRERPGVLRSTERLGGSEFQALQGLVEEIRGQRIREDFQTPERARERLETFRARRQREQRGILGPRPQLSKSQVQQLKRIAGEQTATQRVLKKINQSLGPTAKQDFANITRQTRQLNQGMNRMRNELKTSLENLAQQMEIDVTTQIDGRTITQVVIDNFDTIAADVGINTSL